jgi:hypothetical protein
VRIRTGQRHLSGEVVFILSRILHTAPLGFRFWIWQLILLLTGWQRRSDYCQRSSGGSHQLGLWLCQS